MMSDDEIIAVVQAHKEGKRIEFRDSLVCGWCNPNREWRASDDPAWDFFHREYRVAREPRVWSVPLHVLESADGISWCQLNSVKVREVLE